MHKGHLPKYVPWKMLELQFSSMPLGSQLLYVNRSATSPVLPLSSRALLAGKAVELDKGTMWRMAPLPRLSPLRARASAPPTM